MNMQDIKVALRFLYCDDREQIVLQCKQASNIPYIKRMLKNILGEPDKAIDNSSFYRHGKDYKMIHIKTISTDMHGFRDEDLFYVSYCFGDDWDKLASTAFWLDNRLDMGNYLLTDSFGLIDAYNMMVRDGLTGDHALSCLSNEAFVKVEGIKAWEL